MASTRLIYATSRLNRLLKRADGLATWSRNDEGKSYDHRH
jgi:hypothetical protein